MTGQKKKVGFDVYQQCMDSFTLFFWDCRYREALATGQHSRIILVVDCTGYDLAALRRTWTGLATLSRWQKTYPGGQGPADGIRLTLVRNVPVMLDLIIRVVGRMMSAKSRERIQLFSTRNDDAFRHALFRHVEPSQVPRSIGGDCDQAFTLDINVE